MWKCPDYLFPRTGICECQSIDREYIRQEENMSTNTAAVLTMALCLTGVGDLIDITYTRAVLTDVERAQ